MLTSLAASNPAPNAPTLPSLSEWLGKASAFEKQMMPFWMTTHGNARGKTPFVFEGHIIHWLFENAASALARCDREIAELRRSEPSPGLALAEADWEAEKYLIAAESGK